MIEELQAILGMIGDLSAIAGWLVGGFILFKLTIYLSTVGIIYNLVKLFIDKTHNWATAPRQTDMTGKIKALCIDERTSTIIMRVLKATKDRRGGHLSYLHDSDAEWLMAAVEDKISTDKTERGGEQP